ncbi:MAG: hypothetical protein M1831_006647 [Alyxoria varia]|nr:MAG: hypothetical protein M1831_006647 [Alyxoria varia]
MPTQHAFLGNLTVWDPRSSLQLSLSTSITTTGPSCISHVFDQQKMWVSRGNEMTFIISIFWGLEPITQLEWGETFLKGLQRALCSAELWSKLDLEVSPISYCSDPPPTKSTLTGIELLVRHASTFSGHAKPNPHRLNVEAFPGSVKPPDQVPQAKLNNVCFDISLSECMEVRSTAEEQIINTHTASEDMIDDESPARYEEPHDDILEWFDGANDMPPKNPSDHTQTANSENTHDEFFEKTLPLLDRMILLAVLGRAHRRKDHLLVMPESSFEALSAAIPSMFRPGYLQASSASSKAVNSMSHANFKVQQECSTRLCLVPTLANCVAGSLVDRVQFPVLKSKLTQLFKASEYDKWKDTALDQYEDTRPYRQRILQAHLWNIMQQKVAPPRAAAKHLSNAFGNSSDVGLRSDLLEADWDSGAEGFEYNEFDELDEFNDLLESSSMFSEGSDEPCELRLSPSNSSECLSMQKMVSSGPLEVRHSKRTDLQRTPHEFILEKDCCLDENEPDMSQLQTSNTVNDASPPPSLISSMMEDVFDGQSCFPAEEGESAIGDCLEAHEESDPTVEMELDSLSDISLDLATEEFPEPLEPHSPFNQPHQPKPSARAEVGFEIIDVNTGLRDRVYAEDPGIRWRFVDSGAF